MSRSSTLSADEHDVHAPPSPEGYKPLWIARFIVHHPKKILIGMFVLIMLLTMIAFSMSFKNDTDGESFRVRNHDTNLKYHGVVAGLRDTQFTEPVTTSVTQQSRAQYAITFVYRTKDDSNLLTQANLDVIKAFEEEIVKIPDYDKYCLARQVAGTTTCWPISSLMNELYDTAGNLKTPLTTTLANIEATRPDLVERYFDKRFSANRLESILTRSFVTFGLPLAGYSSLEDRKAEQLGKVEGWLKDTVYPVIKKREAGNVQLLFVGSIVTQAAFDDIILGDALLALGAMVFVFIVTYIHTRSFFLTSLGMLHVLLAFPVAYFFYRVVLQLKAFNVLNFLGIFVILGIGADDIYIFVDAWKQSLYEAPALCASGLINRMSYAYRRAAKAMLITSLTTAIAFLANVISSIPPIRFFGAFMGFLVMMNFVLVITWFPCVVILWHYGNTYGWFACWKVKTDFANTDTTYMGALPVAGTEMNKVHPSEDSTEHSSAAHASIKHDDESTEVSRGDRRGSSSSNNSSSSSSSADDGGKDLESGASHSETATATAAHSYSADNNDGGDHRWLERFFRDKYSEFIIKWRWVIIGFFSCLLIGAIVGAAQLKPAEDPARFLRDSHVIQRALDGISKEFKTGEITVTSSLVWGLGRVNRDGTDITDASDIGNPTWDATFPPKIGEVATQEFFIDTCAQIRQAAVQGSAFKNGDLGIRTDALTNAAEVECFMERIRDYRTTVQAKSWPIPTTTEFNQTMYEYINHAVATAPPSGSAANVFETTNVAEEGAFSSIRFDKQSKELRFVHIYVNLTIPIQLPEAKTRPYYNAWNSFINERNADPKSPSNGYQASGKWVQMQTEAVLVSSALAGAGLSIALGFIVITVSTMNIIIGAYSILSIIAILIFVACSIVLFGWQLGIIESVCMTVVVGLSIDYVVHFANAYIEAHVNNRVGRIKSALTTLGISVFGAAITTIGSAIVLFFTTVLFFVKFGQFIAISLAWSMVVAFVLFFAILAVGGPQGETGSLWPLWYKVKGLFIKPKQ